MEVTTRPTVQLLPAAQATLRAALDDGIRDGVEPCGYLLGQHEAASIQVTAVRAGRNRHAQPHSAFHLTADEHLAARRDAAARGLGVVGIWHGHRRGAAEPSQADRDGMLSEHPVLARRMPALMLIAAAPDAPGPWLQAYVRDGVGSRGRSPSWVAWDLEA